MTARLEGIVWTLISWSRLLSIIKSSSGKLSTSTARYYRAAGFHILYTAEMTMTAATKWSSASIGQYAPQKVLAGRIRRMS
jgi:hypothetical protein